MQDREAFKYNFPVILRKTRDTKSYNVSLINLSSQIIMQLMTSALDNMCEKSKQFLMCKILV